MPNKHGDNTRMDRIVSEAANFLTEQLILNGGHNIFVGSTLIFAEHIRWLRKKGYLGAVVKAGFGRPITKKGREWLQKISEQNHHKK